MKTALFIQWLIDNESKKTEKNREMWREWRLNYHYIRTFSKLYRTNETYNIGIKLQIQYIYDNYEKIEKQD